MDPIILFVILGVVISEVGSHRELTRVYKYRRNNNACSTLSRYITEKQLNGIQCLASSYYKCEKPVTIPETKPPATLVNGGVAAGVANKPLNNSLANPQCNTNDPEYKFEKQLERCYKFQVENKMIWHNALLTCHREGSYLAIVNSDAEAKYLASFVRKCGHDHSIIGFHNSFYLNATYMSVDGQPLLESGLYMKWAEGEPNKRDGEHCGAISRDGGLSDIYCDASFTFICERDL